MARYTIKELTDKYKDGSLTPTQHIKGELKKIQKLVSQRSEINAIVEIMPLNDILKQAAESTKRYANNSCLGPFDGVPITVKDSILCEIKGKKMEMGSNVSHLDDKGGLFGIAEETSPQIAMLSKQGAIILCITTCPELGHKGLTTSYLRGITRNAHDPTLSTGGSSGGSGATISLGIGSISIGTDGGGSVRIPSAWCGIFGFKPSYSMGCCYHPMYPYIGVAGPMSLNIDDIRLYLDLLYNDNKSKNDHYVIPNNLDFSENFMKKGIKNLNIAISKNYDGVVNYVDNKIWTQILSVVDYLKKYHDANITFIEPPLNRIKEQFEGYDYYKCWLDLWVSFMGPLYSEYIEQYPDLKYSVDPGILDLIERSKKMTMKDLIICNQVRDVVIEIMTNFHKKYDLLITPTTAILPLKVKSYLDDLLMNDKITNDKINWFDCYHNNVMFTSLCNLTFQPAMSINIGNVTTKYGKAPIGMQIIGRNNEDNLILRLAYCVQQQYKSLIAKL